MPQTSSAVTEGRCPVFPKKIARAALPSSATVTRFACRPPSTWAVRDASKISSQLYHARAIDTHIEVNHEELGPLMLTIAAAQAPPISTR